MWAGIGLRTNYTSERLQLLHGVESRTTATELQPQNHKIYHEHVNGDQNTWTFVTVDFNSAITDLKCPDLHGYSAALANAPWNPAKHMEVPSFSSLRNQFSVVQFYLHRESWALQASEESLKNPAQSWKALFNHYCSATLGAPCIVKTHFPGVPAEQTEFRYQVLPLAEPNQKLETRNSVVVRKWK